ncbi:DUF2975 domain-containing protein [Flavivirga aquimarina]|uniref:DUF2975 domain-containing protein n=1 Tax=Flavivirga aquimarina TaxID=2027862 RepID=A0ABT8WEI7_9FLAO|nr:DUF2975 domain-containing protein [Flavivirga aquimarina]MDO5971550.1 DUF2975 domain-containing protein [Flavivirga aquimarina]
MIIKLNIFQFILALFVNLYILALLFYMFITFTGGHTIPKELFRSSFFEDNIELGFYIYFIVTIIIDTLFVYSLIQLLRVVGYFKKNLLFTSKIIKLLKTVGKHFVLIAIVSFSTSIFYNYSFSENFIESMLLPFFYHFMVLIIGFGILVFEEIQRKACQIKEENDLTI